MCVCEGLKRFCLVDSYSADSAVACISAPAEQRVPMQVELAETLKANDSARVLVDERVHSVHWSVEHLPLH